MEKENTSHPGSEHNKLLLEWKTPEYIRHTKGKMWYIAASTLMLGLIIYALFTNSATMAIVFIVLTGVYYLTHSQDPKIIDVKITELGIYIDKKFYAYNMINSFWLVYNPPFVHKVYLRIGTQSFSKVSIELNQQNPVEVRQILIREIPEIEGQQESMTDLLIRMLRL